MSTMTVWVWTTSRLKQIGTKKDWAASNESRPTRDNTASCNKTMSTFLILALTTHEWSNNCSMCKWLQHTDDWYEVAFIHSNKREKYKSKKRGIHAKRIRWRVYCECRILLENVIKLMAARWEPIQQNDMMNLMKSTTNYMYGFHSICNVYSLHFTLEIRL